MIALDQQGWSQRAERRKTLRVACRSVGIEQFKELLKPALDLHPQGGVVFDADGTLWSHDVGCMVFDYTLKNGEFRGQALSLLLEEGRRCGLEMKAASTAHDAARLLQEAWYRGDYAERSAAEMQVWAYAGYAEDEFRQLARSALAEGGHEQTLHTDVLALAEWVREQGGEAFIVSASPLWVIQEATSALGFSSAVIAAGEPHFEERASARWILPGMGNVLPYGPDKVSAGRALLGERPWLAALGDSGFDLEMMQAAALAGAIGSKAALLEGLGGIPHAVRLEIAPPGPISLHLR